MTAKGWDGFSDDWKRALDEHPRIGYFKHNEAMGTKGQFEGWSETERDAKVMRLARVITKHTPDYGMYSVLDLGGFLSLFKSSTLSRKQIDSVLHRAYPF